MTIPFLSFIFQPKGERDCHYWHNGYYVRIFKEKFGWGWQVFRNDKFVFRNGRFVDLIDGGLLDTDSDACRSAEEYIENCLE